MKEPEIIKRLVEFINAYDNPNGVPDGKPAPITAYSLMRYTVSSIRGGAAFKWYVGKKEFDSIVKYCKIKLKRNQKVLKVELTSDYKIEFELVPGVC
jgi:hypothetical protein